MYNDHLVYKVLIWILFGISLWTEKVALKIYHCDLTDKIRVFKYWLHIGSADLHFLQFENGHSAVTIQPMTPISI